ncbi:hypothetical protein EJ03DRAFT_218651 [Teratosphaeria nubilosa]|uniref:Uncharacterized protein n=1 Tax=Teratosphaeria nubilosa TaxID=161662 RepID=A0A6G1KY06_9PEZI|nr:hypothetical protein EJ03DRAFT_218651 [Teratosphaeria nubilosa]
MILPSELRVAILLFAFADKTSSLELTATTTTTTTTSTFVQYPSSGTVAPPTFNVPATGSGSSYASACNTELRLYSSIISGHPPGYGTPITTTRLVTGTAFTASTTTLCDGRPRVWGTITPVSHITSTQTVYAYTNYSGPPPSCTIGPSDCLQLQSAYVSSLNSYNSYQSASSTDLPLSDMPHQPMCQTPEDADVCGQCTIAGGKVELLYFPVTRSISRDMCATTATSPIVCPFGETVAATSTATQGYAPCSYKDFGSPNYTGSGSYIIRDGATLYENLAYIA